VANAAGKGAFPEKPADLGRESDWRDFER